MLSSGLVLPLKFFILSLALGGLVNAQISVNLTDPRLLVSVDGASTNYDASRCGGSIYLANVTNSVTWKFNGSDFQIETVYQEYGDRRDIVIFPEGFTSNAGGLNETSVVPPDQPVDCSKRGVQRVSEILGGQLFLGNHAATLMNGGDLKWKGTGIILTGITYWPDPLPGVPTLTSDPSQRKSLSSGSSKTGVIVGVVVGIVGFLALIVPTIVICRRRRSRGSKIGGMGGAHQDLPTLGATSAPKQQAEGLAASPSEKSAIADVVTSGPQATTNIFRRDVKSSADAPGTQELQAIPTLAPTSQPLPVRSPVQLSPPESTAAQLSAQQLRLVQELMDNGLPSTQVVSVVQSMLTSSGSSSALPGAAVPDTELHAADMEPPPDYDFKDRPTRGA